MVLKLWFAFGIMGGGLVSLIKFIFPAFSLGGLGTIESDVTLASADSLLSLQ